MKAVNSLLSIGIRIVLENKGNAVISQTKPWTHVGFQDCRYHSASTVSLSSNNSQKATPSLSNASINMNFFSWGDGLAKSGLELVANRKVEKNKKFFYWNFVGTYNMNISKSLNISETEMNFVKPMDIS